MEAVDKEVELSIVSRVSLNIPENAYLIGMVGRISRQKAPDVFIRVAAALKNILPDAYFMIVGDGEQRADIERLIRNEGLEGRIMITGWVDNPIAYACLFNQALLLSRWEGFGLVLAEYMKLEKPIVATNVDAIPDLITDYENGLLVEADNVDQAVEAVYKLYNDNILREKVIKNGSMRVNAFFNVSRVANEHERLIVKLCEQGDKKCKQSKIGS